MSKVSSKTLYLMQQLYMCSLHLFNLSHKNWNHLIIASEMNRKSISWSSEIILRKHDSHKSMRISKPRECNQVSTWNLLTRIRSTLSLLQLPYLVILSNFRFISKSFFSRFIILIISPWTNIYKIKRGGKNSPRRNSVHCECHKTVTDVSVKIQL